MNRWIWPVVVILIAAAAVLYFTRGSSQQGSTATSTPESVQITTATIQESTTTYSIDVQYPQFGIPGIDAQIKKAVDDAVAEIKSFPANPPEMASPQNELTIRWQDPYVGPDVISVRLIISEYTGGAHPNSLFSGINFDRATDRQLLQQDAFAMIGMTVAEVSAGATQQLKQKLADAFQFTDGADTNPENFSSFLIGTSSVTFIFQPYQVASYAAGVQEVSFPRLH